MTKVTTDGTIKYDHKNKRFTSLSYTDDTPADINKFWGTADVYFNDDSAWKQGKMNLSLLSDQVLKIDTDFSDIDNHFHNDPIYGMVAKRHNLKTISFRYVEISFTF
jgi:hypothetical protein